MARPPVTEGWQSDTPPPDDFADDVSPNYVDAATVALRFASTSVDASAAQPSGLTEAVTPRSLRDAMGCLATGVCVITTFSGDNDVAMTANSVTSVSLEPPLVLVCIAKTARFHEAILRSARWGVSILDAGSHELSTQFATPGRDAAGQLAQVRFDRGPETGVALLSGSVAQLECVTTDVHQAGDHDVIIGEVRSLAQVGPGKHPLLFHRGRYRWLL
ncbi:flavin reductase family protein [Flexivirga sp.]|uniref:flavin reductase family protein n=1 Tax=Flexivirga sp. TaxID=1962927 RepID=UPI003F7D300B